MSTLEKNRLVKLFSQKPGNLLSVFFTAGFPGVNDTRRIIRALTAAGADLIEVGMPFSDPIADGPTIQASNLRALDNGMTLDLLLSQLEGMRQETEVPVLLMGYINPVLQMGWEPFLSRAAAAGVDGLILPDLPIAEYEEEVKPLMQAHGLVNVFLITPQTSDARIRQIDALSEGFIYLVSSDSITGKTGEVSATQVAYFERISAMHLKTPTLMGFGIHNHATYRTACAHTSGAIIGSAFIHLLDRATDLETDIHSFVQSIRTPQPAQP